MKTYTKSVKCTICNCIIVVRKKDGIKPSLMRALAVADHTKTLHPSKIK